MNSKDARVATVNQRDAAFSAFSQKSRKKRKAADFEGLNSAYNHISVGPTESASAVTVDHEGKTVRPHYRKGFVRTNQRYGPGRSLTRPVFIPAVLVNAKLIAAGDALPAKKEYDVGTRRQR